MNESGKTFSIKARNMSVLAALSVVVIHAGNGGMGSFTAKMLHQFFGWGLCTFAVWCTLFACFAGVLAVGQNLETEHSVVAGLSWRWFVMRGFGLDVSSHPLLVPFWYIRSLMVIVFLSPILVWALRRGRWLVPAAILPVYVYCCGLHDRYQMPWFVFYSVLSLAGWFYFSVGVLARRENWAARSCRVPSWMCWGVALVGICVGRLALLSIWVAQLLHKFLPRGSRVLFGGR